MSPIAIFSWTKPVQAKALSSNTKVTSWFSLPVEVRQMILSIVSLPKPGRPLSGPGSPRMAHLAGVCGEWQDFFEARIFRRLVLNPDSLDEFDAIIRRRSTRLGHIRKLWLRIELPKYVCPDCKEAEDKETIHRNDMIFTTCIHTLFGTLNLWDPTRHEEEGLELMMSASSPSDAEHHFKRYEIKDDYPFHYDEDLDLVPSMTDFHRAKLSTPFRLRFIDIFGAYPTARLGGHLRVRGTPLRLNPRRGEGGRFISQYKCLPVVPIVKGLVMRRQFRREIHVRTLARLLGQCFIALEWFRYERTVSFVTRDQHCFDQGFQMCALPSLPASLRHLSFTQWEVPVYGAGVSEYALGYLPRGMAKLTQKLEHLSPPWQMDATAFLQSIIELKGSLGMLKSPLKRLALRCSLSGRDRSRREFEALVILAGRAALLLPRLEVMEIWGTCLDGQGSRAYIFQYSHVHGRASVSWRSSEGCLVTPRSIVTQWNVVALKHSHSTLSHDAVPFAETKAEIFKSQGSCIYRHLLLKGLVFDPITQIILENEPTRWGLNDDAGSGALGGNLAMDTIEPDTEDTSLQAEILAFEAQINNFFQS